MRQKSDLCRVNCVGLAFIRLNLNFLGNMLGLLSITSKYIYLLLNGKI